MYLTGNTLQILVLIVGNLSFFFCYKVNLPFFEKYKSIDEPWPWQTDKQEWDKLFWRSIKLTAFNSLVMNFVFSYPSIAADAPIPFRDDLNYASPLTLLLQFMFCNMAENISFYMSHSLLHKPFFYKMIHKIHHEHKVTTSIATIHAHPLEYLFGNGIPSVLGCLILGKRMHMSSYFAWGFWRNCEALYGHSGYAFSWNPFRLLPFHSDGREHPFHHSENVGNYSSTTNVWDYIYGTNSAFRKQLKELHIKTE
jgi:sterol desaturase/sphingolipid hydroxylase (fatty acid hydroxylase superfamily)